MRTKLSNYRLCQKWPDDDNLLDVTTNDGEPHHFFKGHVGDVTFRQYDSAQDGVVDEVVGHYEAYTILADEAVRQGYDPVLFVCEAVSEGVLELGQAVCECSNNSYTNFFRMGHGLAKAWGGDILAIEFIELDKKHRGFGLGLAVLDTLIRRFGSGAPMVVLRPFPPQYSNRVDPSNEAEFNEALGKLREYYGQLGFKPLRGAPEYMALERPCRRPFIEMVSRFNL